MNKVIYVSFYLEDAGSYRPAIEKWNGSHGKQIVRGTSLEFTERDADYDAFVKFIETIGGRVMEGVSISYTPAELLEFEYFFFTPGYPFYPVSSLNGNVEWEGKGTCPVCRGWNIGNRVASVTADLRKGTKFDVLSLGGSPMIVSTKLKSLIMKQCKFDGDFVRVKHVRGYDRKGRRIDRLDPEVFVPFPSPGEQPTHAEDRRLPHRWALNIDGRMGTLRQDLTKVDDKGSCKSCGDSFGFYQTIVGEPRYYDRASIPPLDIMLTNEVWGTGEGRWIVVSRRFYAMLLEHGMRKFMVEPAYLV